MKRRTILMFVGLFLFSLAGASLARAQGPDTDQEATTVAEEDSPTVYDLIRDDPRLASFELLVEAAGLSDNLAQDGPFTVLAPTNEALAAFEAAQDEGSMKANAAGQDAAVTPTDILLYHVINGRYSTAMLAEKRALPTLQGSRLLFDAGAQTTVINETATVVEADMQATNGVVHIVDSIVPLPAQDALIASKAGDAAKTMLQVLADDGRFETLVTLAQQAGLAEMLDNPRARLTLFAPTDEAFDDVSQELMDRWLSDREELRTMLMYHIVGDRLNINQVATSNYLPTLEGRALTVTTDEDVQVYLNGRAVQDFNLISANGAIHVVDEVVLP